MSSFLVVRAWKINVNNPLRKLVLLKLCDNANDDGVCWPSVQHIADHCNMSYRSVTSHIKELVNLGILSVENRTKDSKKVSNYYTINLDDHGRITSSDRQELPMQSEVSTAGAAYTHRQELPIESVIKNLSIKPSISFESIKDLWNEILGEDLGKVNLITENRKRSIHARISESKKRQSIDWWRNYFEHISESNFLTGKSGKDSNGNIFKPNLDWVLNQSNMTKIIENWYHRYQQ
jgi:predicted transcriptional regulator